MSLIAYFDCFGGISGDMALGALLDAGGEMSVLAGAVVALGLGGEVSVSARREERGHLGGMRVRVECGPGPARSVPQLEGVIAGSGLPPRVEALALDAVGRLGRAEARLHGRPVGELHLHELGGADTLVDLVGTFWLLESLGVEAVHASPLPAPAGMAGGLPLPAPAALEVLAGSGAVWRPVDGGGETVTPTGAAILAAVARFDRPAMTVERTGSSFGERPEPGNGMRVWIGEPRPEGGPEAAGAADRDQVAVLETNLDDMSPQLVAALAEDLLAEGALDVTVTPVLMKKGRPGHLVGVICEPARAEAMGAALLASSSTLGVRLTLASRLLAGRRLVEVTSRFGTARVKVKRLGGRTVDVSPEYEDCRRLAGAAGVGVREVMRAVEEAARRELLS